MKVGTKRDKSGGIPQKYILTDRNRQLILDLYDSSPERTDLLCKQMPGIPRWKIQKWAAQLGKTGKQYADRWNEEDERYLRKNFQNTPLPQLQEKLGRAKTTILRKAARLGLSRGDRENTYNLQEVAEALGVSEGRARVWVTKGWLKGNKAVDGDWYFADKNIKEFVRWHPDQLNPHKFDWLWLADLMMGNEMGLGEIGGDLLEKKPKKGRK